MSNLPDMDFKEKKDKKKGFLPWLRSRLGLGDGGAMSGAGQAVPGAANFGRATLGAARIGASSGGMLAGKFGLIATLTVVGVAIGTTLYMKNPSIMDGSFNSNGSNSGNYIPSGMRAQNQGSSLEMFKETNKGGIDPDANAAAGGDSFGEAANAPVPAETASEDPGIPTPDAAVVPETKVKLAGSGGLSGTAGGGGNKISGMGGAAPKLNSSLGGGLSGGIGMGFQTNSNFEQRKKILAMKGSSRPVFSSAKGGKSGVNGKGAFAQAKGLRSTQKSSVGTNADAQRSTQDKAWEGSTPEGTVTGGTGVAAGPGGSGIVTSPSLDNTGGGGGGNGYDGHDADLNETPTTTDVSPWKGLPAKAMMLILASAALSVWGAYLISLGEATSWIGGVSCMTIGYALCGIAMGLAAMAIGIGIKLMSTHGQALMGSIYTIGGGVALGAAAVAMTGNMAGAGMTWVLWMAAIAGVMSLLGVMMGSK